ncbi:MAG: LysM peptidoglycan-binding domain-containing protein [Anaerolineales bacterium]
MGSVRRKGWRQYIPFLVLNVVVSAITVLLVLALWNPGVQVELPTPTPTLPAQAVAASAVPTATATVPPSPTPQTYTVQPGDSMNGIALELGVSTEDLMAANGLTDPDTLSAGQVLQVPSVGESTQAQATQVPTAAPQPTEGDGEGPEVEIRGVVSPGDIDEEAVRLLNTGGVANMAGWTLEDGEGNTYTFPAFTLHNGAVSVHTRSGTDTVIDLYWGRPEAVWLPGSTITLNNSAGEVQSTFNVPGN